MGNSCEAVRAGVRRGAANGEVGSGRGRRRCRGERQGGEGRGCGCGYAALGDMSSLGVMSWSAVLYGSQRVGQRALPPP